MIRNYKDLVVWQKSMTLVVEVYQLVKKLPKEETYVLSDQMRRSAVSIPSNIAEGYNRNSDKELLQFLHIARGSKAELETQLMLAIRLGYFTQADTEKTTSLCEEVGKLLNAFIAHLK